MLTKEWLCAFVPLGILHDDQKWVAIGAGFLYLEPPVVWLVTASHVIRDAGQRPLTALVSDNNGRLIVVNLTEVHQNSGLHWHTDDTHDVAIGLMPQDASWQIKAITKEFCLPFSEILPSMTCYTVGCPYGVRSIDPTKATPLVLDGVVAGVNSVTKEIYTSAPTFPGNSGGPLLIFVSPINPAGGMVVGRTTLFVAGIMKQTALVPDPAQALLPLHLGIGVSIDPVLQLLDSPSVRAERERVLQSAPK